MIDRREFLKTAGIGTLGMLAGPGLFLGAPFAAERKSTAAVRTQYGFNPDLEIALSAVPEEIPIFAGRPTQVWRYRARLIKGNPKQLVNMPGSYLGPMIKVNTGDNVRIRLDNQIPDETIIHWHGLHVPAEMDGHPRFKIPPGKSFLYEFKVKNRAGTYWYHPHPHGRTGFQVYGGMAGLLIVSDEEEKAAGLPAGEYDIPLVIQDRLFGADNQLVYEAGNMMGRMNGMLGDRILVNGQPDFTLPVSTRAYRFRVLNGSNARIYRLAWEDGRPLTIIGTDGGLLHKPVQRSYVFLSPGERIELYADFSDSAVGGESALVSLPFNAGGMGYGAMGGGMMGGVMGNNRGLANGAGFTLFKVKAIRRETAPQPLPPVLSRVDFADPRFALNAGYPRRFDLVMGHMRWTINGRTFQTLDVAEDEMVNLGTTEIWEFNNMGGGMGMMGMMQQPHPMHLHGKQFQVLERGGVTHNGYVDEGWKDTVLLMPGERIRILVGFADYAGLFLYHCHNLEHADMGMMRNYLIRA